MIERIACIPTMLSRMDIIERSALSIARQVDKLFIFCNENAQLPESLLHEKNIHRVDDVVDRGSIGRFFISNMEGYLFFCDDDLIYPEHYCDRLISAIEERERKAICGYHGRTIPYPLISYYGSHSLTVYPCRNSFDRDHEVNFLGTGCMCYHSSTLKISMDDFKHNNLDDAEFSILCHKQNIPMIVVAHEGLEYMPPTGDTIWDATMRDQRPLLELINSFSGWKKL